MSIYQYPNYLDFIKNERKTLNFLANSTFIKKSFSELSDSAELSFYDLKIKDQILRKHEFSFGCNFDIKIESNIRRIALEALILPNFSLVSYVLSICENNEAPLRVIRKFHFDYAIPNIHEEPKPVYHIQYGGETSPQILALNIDIAELQPWLSTPRIRFYPINLALLLDMVFNEFRSDETVGIVERSEWRDFIKSNEEIILKPFYAGVARFLNGDHKSKYLLRDFYYGREN
jgi:hypothetical protein